MGRTWSWLDKFFEIGQTNKQKRIARSCISSDGRITASIFLEICLRFQKHEIKNPGKVATILSKICDQKNNCISKATEWRKRNESVARQEYIKHNAQDCTELSVVETGLFFSCENPFFRAPYDGIVSCECHKLRLLEITCPLTHRQISDRLC